MGSSSPNRKPIPPLRKHRFVAIEGNIGSGKTTLARMLAHRFHGRLMLESFAENTFLHRFYRHPQRYAFPLELSFMADRFNQLKGVLDKEPGRLLVADFFFDKCLLFARVNLDTEEFRLFESFYRVLYPQIAQPDLVVFLDQDVDRLTDHIGKRGRWFESEMDPGYLRRIGGAYEAYLQEPAGKQVLRLDVRNVDFVNNPADYMDIITRISEA